MLQSNIITAPSSSMINDQKDGDHIFPPFLLQYWQIVLRWKFVIGGITLLALIVGLVATLLMTPKYTAAARIEISRDQKNVTNVQGVAPDDGRDLEFYQTQYSLLESESLAARVVRQLRLAKSDTFFAQQGVSSSQLEKLGPASGAGAAGSGREKLAIDLLLHNVTIAPIRNSALVDVQYTSNSPDLAAQIANTWVQQFVAQSNDRRMASTSEARKFLEGRLADLRMRLQQSERDVVTYASQNGIVALTRTQGMDGKTQTERTLASADLEALNTALAQAISDRIAAESRANAPGARGTNADAINSAALAQLRQRRAEIAAEYAKLMVQFEPGYPAARALNEQMKALDASIAREEGRIASSRSNDYQQALAREQILSERVTRLKNDLDRQQRATIQYNIYQRDADTNRQLYDALLQRYKEIGIAGVGADNIAIIDSAKVPDRPSSPKLFLNMGIALLCGLALAGVATFALDQIDEGLRDPGDINRLLQIPLLGSVPTVKEGKPFDLLSDTKSTLAEAYLTVQSNLAFSTSHGVPRSFIVTSTRPAEGKSTTSYAIATVLGRIGKKVVLIDADMRNPSIHHMLGIGNISGLSNFLAGDNDWAPLIHGGQVRGVDIMPAGPMPPSAAELLSSDRMSMLINRLFERYDHVVIDSPPILGLADAPLLARSVEGCVLVIEAGGVSVRGLKSSLARLESAHAHIFGAVLTKIKEDHSGYGYGYSYNYSYGQSKS